MPQAERLATGVVCEDVTVTYTSRGGARKALDDVSFSLPMGETLAIVGESGAGKSTLTRVVAGLEKPGGGHVTVQGVTPGPRSGVVSPVQIVFQHPAMALNRFASVGASIAEPLGRLAKPARRARVRELLASVGLDPDRADEKPNRFSGGQLQRIVFARALAAEPALLICDEATSALDVSVQAQIVNLLLDLQREQGFACLFVTHDLGVARVVANAVLVLERGRAVEQGPADAFFAAPQSAYARSLLEATAAQAVQRRSA